MLGLLTVYELSAVNEEDGEARSTAEEQQEKIENKRHKYHRRWCVQKSDYRTPWFHIIISEQIITIPIF